MVSMKRTLVAVAVSLSLLFGQLTPTPAAAHEIGGQVQFWMGAYCGVGRAELNHATYYVDILGTESTTYVYTNFTFFGIPICLTAAGGKVLAPGQIRVASLLANESNGQWCTYSGWVYNASSSSRVTTYSTGINWPKDDPPPCGAGYYVNATAHGVYNGGWVPGSHKSGLHWIS